MGKYLLTSICAVLCLQGATQPSKPHKGPGMLPDSCLLVTFVEAGRTDMRDAGLFLDWNGEPCIVRGNRIGRLLPDSAGFIPMELPDRSAPSQIICTGGGTTYLKSGNLIRVMRDKKIETLFDMGSGDFRIGGTGEQLLYITTWDRDSSRVFLYDTSAALLLKLCAVRGRINDVAGDGVNTYVATGDGVYMLFDGRTFKAMSLGSEVKKLAWTEGGLFFSSATGIGFIADPGQPFPFINRPAREILAGDDALYILFEDGGVAALLGTGYFESFVRKIYR